MLKHILVYLDICLDVCMSFCTLTLRIFVFARRSTSQTSLNRILSYEIDWNSSISNRVSGGGKVTVTGQFTTRRNEGKSCVGMFSCVKVLCVTTYSIKNIFK